MKLSETMNGLLALVRIDGYCSASVPDKPSTSGSP